MIGSDPTATTRRPGEPGNRGVQLFQGWSISFRGSVARVDGVVESLSGESCRARSDSSGGDGHQRFPLPWTCNVDTCTTDARDYSFEFSESTGSARKGSFQSGQWEDSGPGLIPQTGPGILYRCGEKGAVGSRSIADSSRIFPSSHSFRMPSIKQMSPGFLLCAIAGKRLKSQRIPFPR